MPYLCSFFYCQMLTCKRPRDHETGDDEQQTVGEQDEELAQISAKPPAYKEVCLKSLDIIES